MGLSAPHYVVIRLSLLQHQVNGSHVVRGVTPIPLSVEVTKAKFIRQPGLDARNGRGDFARYKLVASSRRLVIKKNPTHAIHAVGFAIVARKIESSDFADAI